MPMPAAAAHSEVAQQMPEYGLFNRAYLFRDYAHLRKVFDGPIGADYRRKVAGKR